MAVHHASSTEKERHHVLSIGAAMRTLLLRFFNTIHFTIKFLWHRLSSLSKLFHIKGNRFVPVILLFSRLTSVQTLLVSP